MGVFRGEADINGPFMNLSLGRAMLRWSSLLVVPPLTLLKAALWGCVLV